MKQAHVYISGFVQGVGYRMFVKKTAVKMGLTGWVRNLSDRRVEALIQGEEQLIKNLINRCENGSFFAQVKNITVEWEEVENQLKDFEIRKS